VSAVQGAVSAATQEAREAGEGILASGGNAFDAIVASAIALAVTEPGNSGLGGEGYCIFYDARAAQPGSLCFMGLSGGLATPGNLVGKELLRGVAAPLVPGAVAGWFALISEKCSRPPRELLAPAIRLAEEGFGIGEGLASELNWMADQFHHSARGIFVRQDRPWKAGDRLLQPELVRTLRVLAEGGQQAFYEGEFSERMHRFLCDTGGLLRKGDLVAYRPLWQRTLSRRFGDVEVHVPPPESTGFSVLYGLELLARLGYDSMPSGGLPAVRALVSVLREMEECADGIAARLTPYGTETEEAIAGLLEEDRLAKMAQHLGLDFPGSGTRRGAHTTSLSAGDSSGNLVCLTQTLDHGFGSGVVIPGTGVLMNNGMAWLNTDPSTGRADLVAPRRRFFAPVVPTIALHGSGQPLLALGTPGGRGIPQTTLQVYANLLLYHDALQAAVSRPRVTVGALVPEQAGTRDVRLEPGFAPEVYEELQPAEADQGCQNFGRFHAVQFTPDAGIMGISDPRA